MNNSAPTDTSVSTSDSIPSLPDLRVFQVHGHRGLGIEKPENTITAFKESIQMGLDFVETDIWLTKDLVPVVIHCDTVLGYCKMRTIADHTPKEIYITKITYHDLQQLEYMKSEERVPTFEEVVLLFKNTTTKINCEIKDWNKKTIPLTLDIIIKHDIVNSIFFSSFVHKNRLILFEEEKKKKIE